LREHRSAVSPLSGSDPITFIWAVYDIVRDHGPLSPNEIHDRYTAAVDEPRTKRTELVFLGSC
jgi:hypothetical protein